MPTDLLPLTVEMTADDLADLHTLATDLCGGLGALLDDDARLALERLLDRHEPLMRAAAAERIAA